MTEERSSNSNSDFKQIMVDFNKNLLDIQNVCNNLRIDLVEEKGKTAKLEEKNQFLENKIKSLDLKTKNEVSDLKQIIDQKDEKINSLEKQINKVNASFDEKIGELTLELRTLNNTTCKVFYIHITNKWKEIKWNCCENNCINKDNPYGNCIKGNGFINIIDDENIKYIKHIKGKGRDLLAIVYPENHFDKPEDCINYSLFYYEVKCKFEKSKKSYKNWMDIGLNCNDDLVKLNFNYHSIDYKIQNEVKEFKLPRTFSWNDGDIFGCGLVYPPTNKINELPYIFFTQNGRQIGKAVVLNDNFDCYKPYVLLKCCSVETNFGNDLENKPFIYDITKHILPKQFYEDSDAVDEDSDSDESDLDDEDKLTKEEKDINELAEMFPLINKEGIKQILMSKGGNKEIVVNILNDIFTKND